MGVCQDTLCVSFAAGFASVEVRRRPWQGRFCYFMDFGFGGYFLGRGLYFVRRSQTGAVVANGIQFAIVSCISNHV